MAFVQDHQSVQRAVGVSLFLRGKAKKKIRKNENNIYVWAEYRGGLSTVHAPQWALWIGESDSIQNKRGSRGLAGCLYIHPLYPAG